MSMMMQPPSGRSFGSRVLDTLFDRRPNQPVQVPVQGQMPPQAQDPVITVTGQRPHVTPQTPNVPMIPTTPQSQVDPSQLPSTTDDLGSQIENFLSGGSGAKAAEDAANKTGFGPVTLQNLGENQSMFNFPNLSFRR